MADGWGNKRNAAQICSSLMELKVPKQSSSKYFGGGVLMRYKCLSFKLFAIYFFNIEISWYLSLFTDYELYLESLGLKFGRDFYGQLAS